jgi:hypothetical protein
LRIYHPKAKESFGKTVGKGIAVIAQWYESETRSCNPDTTGGAEGNQEKASLFRNVRPRTGAQSAAKSEGEVVVSGGN